MQRQVRLLTIALYSELMTGIVLALLLLTAMATINCAPPPPTLGPVGQRAWKQKEIQADLDLIRNVARDANGVSTTLMSTQGALDVVRWHRAAITTLHEAANGWQSTLIVGLTELEGRLSAADKSAIAKYIELAKVVIQETSGLALSTIDGGSVTFTTGGTTTTTTSVIGGVR